MGDETLLRAGEVVLLVDLRRGKRHLVTLRLGQAFHSDRGFIPHDTLVGLPEGVTAVTTRGARYLALRPTLAEYVLEMPRGAQIIYPKDLATIVFLADIGPGADACSRRAWARARSPSCSCGGRAPTGRVVSYESATSSRAAPCGTSRRGIGPVVHLTSFAPRTSTSASRSARSTALVLDLPEPWRLVESAAEALLRRRPLLRLRPHHPPVPARSTRRSPPIRRSRSSRPSRRLLRPWNIDGPSVRPVHRMVAHTGFLTVARRGSAERGGSPGPLPAVAPARTPTRRRPRLGAA